MRKREDVMADGSDLWLSLNKVCGKKVVDVQGYVTGEFGEDCAVFKMHKIVFDDESEVFCEGEHDLPYLTGVEVEDLLEKDEDDE